MCGNSQTSWTIVKQFPVRPQTWQHSQITDDMIGWIYVVQYSKRHFSFPMSNIQMISFPDECANVKLRCVKFTLKLQPHAWQKRGCGVAISWIILAALQLNGFMAPIMSELSLTCCRVHISWALRRCWTRRQLPSPFYLALCCIGVHSLTSSSAAMLSPQSSVNENMIQFQK